MESSQMQAVSEQPSPAAFAELQDELLIATTDLDRLQSLLSDAAGQLLARFVGADALLAQLVAAAQQPAEQAALLGAARAEVAGAAIALQFRHGRAAAVACAAAGAQRRRLPGQPGDAGRCRHRGGRGRGAVRRPGMPGGAATDGRRLDRAVLIPAKPFLQTMWFKDPMFPDTTEVRRCDRF